MFSRVIICFRDKESWIKSAKTHGTLAWIYKVRPYWIPENTYFDIINSLEPASKLYDYWYEQSKITLMYCMNKNIEHYVYHYANDNSFAELRKTFKSADQEKKLTVFNIGGNKARLTAAIHYNTKRVYIRQVLTHAEYDKDKWKE